MNMRNVSIKQISGKNKEGEGQIVCMFSQLQLQYFIINLFPGHRKGESLLTD